MRLSVSAPVFNAESFAIGFKSWIQVFFKLWSPDLKKWAFLTLKSLFNVYSVYLYGVMIHQNVDRDSIFHYIQKKFNSDIIEKLFSSGDVFFSLSESSWWCWTFWSHYFLVISCSSLTFYYIWCVYTFSFKI